MKFLHARITRYRKTLGLSRAELAVKMQRSIPTVSRETIYSWETARTTPRAKYFRVLCRALLRHPKEFFQF